MNLAIFGLGYVGTVSAACLARNGHKVVGVDVNPQKVEMIADGRAPIVEPQLQDLIKNGVRSGCLKATTNVEEAIAETDVALICVSTPSLPNGDLNSQFLETVAGEIGQCLAGLQRRYTVVVRSTALPGTMRQSFIPVLEERSGKSTGSDIGICYHPEFLREGSAVEDYDNPPKVVIGADDPESRAVLEQLYQDCSAEILNATIEEAEMLKYVDNSWHALKVAFANEFGRLCHDTGIDGRRIMSMFCSDTQLNISTKYLRPGFAFGGSCLPKDLRAITYHARNRHDLKLPVLESILPSNEIQIDAGYQLIVDAGHRNVGMVGLSFKPETDDLRESPLVTLAERLIGKGYNLRIFDPTVNLAKLTGANRHYIERTIPHIAELLLPTLDDLDAHAETIIIGHAAGIGNERLSKLASTEKSVIDLAGLFWDMRSDDGTYRGIGW